MGRQTGLEFVLKGLEWHNYQEVINYVIYEKLKVKKSPMVRVHWLGGYKAYLTSFRCLTVEIFVCHDEA